MKIIKNHLCFILAFGFLFGGSLIAFSGYYFDYQRYYHWQGIALSDAKGVLHNHVGDYRHQFDGAIYLKINDTHYVELWCDNVEHSLFAPMKSNSRRKQLGDCNKVFNVNALSHDNVRVWFDVNTGMIYQVEKENGEMVVDKDRMFLYYQNGFAKQIAFGVLCLLIVLIGFMVYAFFPNHDKNGG